MIFAAIMLVAMLIDALIGWPNAVFRRIGHPVTWIGALITALDRRLNHGAFNARILKGGMATAIVVTTAALPAILAQSALPAGITGLLIGGLLAWPLIAVRSMYTHVAAIAAPLAKGDVMAARKSVAMIVGRDPARLDPKGIARASLESLAENTCDGIVAPVFWGVIAGLPGLAAYKAINTLDSMIGHRNDRYDAFGKIAARLDDVANWVPARLTALLFALVTVRARTALGTALRDARHHRSPNAGWPESAMAGALGVRLSGPRLYGQTIADEPWLNATAPDPTPQDLTRGLRLYLRAMAALMTVLLALASPTMGLV